jgi:mannose-6-phosphate isomerase
MVNYGGNQVSTIDLARGETTVFADSPYYYGIHHVSPGGVLSLPALQAMTIYALEIPSTTLVAEERTQTQIRPGDCIQAHQLTPKVAVRDGGRCSFLVAGVGQSKLRPEIVVLRDYEIKKVIKPWGHELWISGEHPEYALKQVFIRAPHKTSLQYHDFKHETIVLFSGSARLHHKRDEAIPNVSLGDGDVIATPLGAISVAHIKPPVLHRFEACSDLTLYEASTPHLHDVIRVSDDSNRPDGRIESEHTAACRG